MKFISLTTDLTLDDCETEDMQQIWKQHNSSDGCEIAILISIIVCQIS